MRKSGMRKFGLNHLMQKVINQIGEPYLSDKLNDMFLEAFPEFKMMKF
jgi:hypothetical protein